MKTTYFLLHRFIFCVFIHMCPICSVSVARPNTLHLLKYTNQSHPSPMQRVVVNNSTGEVYVSARNALYHFTSDLKIKRIVPTGPQLDNPRCLHPAFTCTQTRTLTDNDNKVLEILQMPSFSALLTCGTLYQGLCQLHKLDDISRNAWLQPYNNSVAFISGKGSTAAVFAEGYDNQWSLYSATAYDGRPLRYVSASVSSKVIVQEDDFTVKYSYENGKKYTGLVATFKKEYKVEYIMAFSHGDFVYFLSTQKVAVDSEAIETRLVRVCKKDRTFFSYTEIPLYCEYEQVVYNFATAAHFGVLDAGLKRTLGLDKVVNTLFISFMKHDSFRGGSVDKTKGSVICSFPMTTVIESFTNAIRDCFKVGGQRTLYKEVGLELSCWKKDDVKIDDNFCGSRVNRYIASDVWLQGVHPIHLDAAITSLTTMAQRNVLVAVAGTDTGNVIKVDMNRATVLFAKNIATDQADKRIQSSNALDPQRENIYLLIGNEVVKFPIGSCSVYTDCLSCLTKKDPLKCGWCGDHCTTYRECETPTKFAKVSCSPFIYDVKPVRGPTGGGTIITVSGGSFYTGWGNSMFVKVAGIPCKVFSQTREEVRCKTKAIQNHTLEGTVEIALSDSWEDTVRIGGGAWSKEVFTYLTPLLYGVHPGKGPVSGGTNITLFGYNLDIGYNRSIKVAGVPCKEIGIRNTTAWCVTGKGSKETSEDVESTPRNGSVKLQIDDVVVEVGNQTSAGFDAGVSLSNNFVYLPDPEILTIHPQVTTLSGTKNLIVTGKHLDSVETPRMNISTIDELHIISDPCWFNGSADSNTMICPTPELKSLGLHAPTERVPIVTYVSFIMGDILQLPKCELSVLMYYPDPEYEAFSEAGGIKQVTRDHKHLEIKGRYLNLAHAPSDIKVLFDNATVCNVVSLSADSLSCEIPEVFTASNLTNHSVTVSVGPLTFLLGQVQFIESDEVEFTGSNEVEFTEPNVKTQEPIWYKISGIFIAVAVVLGLVCLYFFYKNRKKRMGNKCPDDKVTFRSHAADENEKISASVKKQDNTSINIQSLHGRHINHQNSALAPVPTIEIFQTTVTTHPLVDDDTMRLLQSQNILVSRNHLSLGEAIGKGHFGCVYKGELLIPGKEDKLEVAVKTLLKSWSSHAQEAEAFLKEGMMMKDFKHRNVLTLIGLAFEANGSPMIIIPYMKHGDLLSYIRDENSNSTIKDLMTFGIHIAAGMKYLAEIRFVHRDLAARNCMLDDDKIVKIADFGLSRDIYERDYYSSDNSKMKLPLKWMAPESIEMGSYTTKSDVWSYGVLLWELMTRGAYPYPEVDNWDILKYIKTGRRMPQPSYCPRSLYNIMIECWNKEPKKRPTFPELEERVQGVLEKLQSRRKSKPRTVEFYATYVNCPETVTYDDRAEETCLINK